jgi:hypothetical protein
VGLSSALAPKLKVMSFESFEKTTEKVAYQGRQPSKQAAK